MRGAARNSKRIIRSKAMVIIIDNYDSFTFNLFQFIGMLTDEVKVYRNDQITVEAIEAFPALAYYSVTRTWSS